MKRAPLVFAVSCAAIAAVAVAAVSLAASGQSAQGTTIHLIEKGQSFHYVDNPPRQALDEPSTQGDMFALSSNLFTRSGKRAGTLRAYCVVATGGKDAATECTGSLALAGGLLFGLTSVRGDQNRIRIAIVGGTGAYEGARGEILTVNKPNSDISEDTIHLLP